MAIYKWGSKGIAVEGIQEALNAAIKQTFTPLKTDGVFGKLTYEAVKLFQGENPPLKDDGVVGPKTMAELARHNKQQVAQASAALAIPTNGTVGQEKSSCDCGYFSAFTLARFVKGGSSLAGQNFSHSAVLAARDSFGGIPEKYHGKEQTGADGVYLKATKAPKFLAHLGVPSFYFQHYFSGNVGKLNAFEFTRQLYQATGEGRNGMMISAPRFGGKDGHWFTVLRLVAVNKMAYALTYDSGGSLPVQAKALGLPAGKHLCWIPTPRLQHALKIVMLGLEAGVVRR